MPDSLGQRLQNAHLTGETLVMGVVNVTPDSFSDGGEFLAPDRAVAHALELVEAGADILDVGGESTRPGADPVAEAEELDRVLPVIEGIVSATEVPVSIDTAKPGVMRRAIAAGAAMINDVNGLRAERAPETVAELDVPVCIMHMLGEPRTMQKNPSYTSVVDDIRDFLRERVLACRAAGIDETRIVLDPGFGFGKTLEHNLELLARLDELVELGFPVLAGMSRKSMLGAITGRENPADRVAASIAAHLIASGKGAAVLRVHDVAETVDALKVARAVGKAEKTR
ncbi:MULTISPECIES: dihydropteroate synthase [unclassified Wenzhouxiangella]|uniref:dihydropteroate synthase n=1 Tax=unclassified Wenzhouxiangella TaxID=2613841 RepID=UPI000E327584|nr:MULTISPECIES: dihydropteroate synthase [unclassified Wenzhouxiangella]RFF28968.1 dihydropteroate synthase [Wenzhouxiangella sp. 15181]RFP68325.1 dihydropteroate synthase [Wenzhouxiangella sp. 15190]